MPKKNKNPMIEIIPFNWTSRNDAKGKQVKVSVFQVERINNCTVYTRIEAAPMEIWEFATMNS